MFNDIKINLVDIVTCPANWSWESRKNGWNGYHLWYVMGGGVSIEVKNHSYHLTKGDSFLFDLNENHLCTHNPEYPLQVATIYLNAPNLNSSLIKRWFISNNQMLGEMILRCVQLHSQNIDFAPNYLKAILTEFLMEDCDIQKKEYSSTVKTIYKTLEETPDKLYSLDEMSHLTGYSKNQIIRLFRNDTGMTPIQFQMYQKMQYAAQMLIYSDKTIAEITLEIGIADANYFSKVFKKYMGKSPKHYRDYFQMNIF